MTEIVVSIFILLGGMFSVLGSIGILRFPDVYLRLHAATKSATLGVICIVIGTFLYFLIIQDQFIGKLLLTIFFVFLTAPVAGFMISKSAYNVGVKMSEKSIQDDLAKAIKIAEKKGKKTSN
ncbi:monovalent cation/H(+) antiporter subunit G [Evansella cellulosilytica]|uniref:Monovalent cation/proton antiporter, MnhG/PhaG subunit n=1 Tax=Evansella cellulosilytica (strain ATCC 21833 / DSM 2522 / FERM P-1141 / JCM 9156 / N-4) TaxID=649639 RepID=E6TVZ8_EVAC2|nr:monovalent cation/H(+) antiporter subunit G [Evansella cellulosilytica]ADU29821.1 monovalent cation/proton antiporter, MnhG/PhaG subunit [Evansella cellulosilytica DSM 2522]